jgi:hypothetical protein
VTDKGPDAHPGRWALCGGLMVTNADALVQSVFVIIEIHLANADALVQSIFVTIEIHLADHVNGHENFTLKI